MSQAFFAPSRRTVLAASLALASVAFSGHALAAEPIKIGIVTALSGQSALLKLTDDKGTVYVVPTSALAYVEIGSEESRRVGFVA